MRWIVTLLLIGAIAGFGWWLPGRELKVDKLMKQRFLNFLVGSICYANIGRRIGVIVGYVGDRDIPIFPEPK